MKNIALLFLCFFTQQIFGQAAIDESGVRGHAVAINSFNAVDGTVAGIFNKQKVILVGELHGTAETAEFVNYLVTNLAGKGHEIYAGLEISPQDMVGDAELKDSTAVSKCPFFKSESFGKASQGWLRLILRLSELSGVHLFFFDVTKQQQAEGAQYRDSLMYVNIKSKMLADTGAVYICLSGNFHNKITADRFPKPMGNYLLQDKELGLSMFNMVSFNTEYAEGEGYFNTGGGTQLHALQNSDYLYTLTSMRNYFSFTNGLIDGDYNGVLFVYHLSASVGVH